MVRAAAEEGTIDVSGTIEWRDGDGELHRAGGPAVVHANGSVKYYVDGVRHRDGAPACVYVNGTEKWDRDGLRHRDDGPAALYPDGRRMWFVDGVKLREERGPALPPRRVQDGQVEDEPRQTEDPMFPGFSALGSS